jgi:hypothetical protein
VEKILQPTVDAAWSHGLAECQVKHFFHGMIKSSKNIFHMGSPCQCLI